MVLPVDDRPKTTGLDIVVVDDDADNAAGNEVAAAVRTPFGDAVRLVALTGLSGDTIRADARAARFDSFIVKPPSLEQLQKALLPQKT